MLEFWFHATLSVTQKLLMFTAIAVLTGLLYWINPLSLEAILMFLATAVVFLICRYCKIQYAATQPTGWLYRLLTWIPIALLLALIFMHLQEGGLLVYGMQGIGFMILGICLFSPWSLFSGHPPAQS